MTPIKAQTGPGAVDEEFTRLTRNAVDWLERACVCLSTAADVTDDPGLKADVRAQVHTLRILRRRTGRLA